MTNLTYCNFLLISSHSYFFIGVAPPEPTLKYYNYPVELNQPVILNCSVSAVPHPEFQWILADTEEPLPESSWNSTFSNKTATSTLKYIFREADLNEHCTIVVMCIATNLYGKSEQHFTLSLNSSESCFFVSSILPSPSVTLEDYINNTSESNSIISTALAIDASPTDFVNTINNTSGNLEIPIIGAIVGAIICLALVLAILITAVCFHKHIYFKNK